MPTIDKLLTGRAPVILDLDSTVIEAVAAMEEAHIGCVLVSRGGKPTGIFTERDLMLRVVAKGKDPGATQLSEVMTQDMFTAPPNRPTAEVRAQMSTRHIRHVPIVAEGGKVLGVLSLRDILRADLEARKNEIKQLTDYIQGDVSS